MTSLRLNERAVVIAERMAADAPLLRVNVNKIEGGATVIDAGVEAAGGYEAGVAIAEICMAGLARIAIVPVTVGPNTYPGVSITTDHPWLSCMGSQYAGWAISVEKFFGMGSGPLRAHARVEKELFERLGYEESAGHGVLVLEGRTLPTPPVAANVAQRAQLDPSALTLVVAPTASVAGSVQISARILETGLHKMETLGFDVRKVVSGFGTAPIATVAKNDLRGIGRTNDCILYGGQAHYTVDAPDEVLADLATKLPASASKDYGVPFYDIFQRYDRDFYKIDPLLFSPAEVWLTSTESGRTFHGGRLAPDILAASLYPA